MVALDGERVEIGRRGDRVSFDFANAATRFPLGVTSRWLASRTGAFWIALGIRAGMNGYDARPVWHQTRWNWPRSSASLALCMRYAILTAPQRAMHDAYCATQDCPSELYDVLPAQTRAAVDTARREAAWKTDAPVVSP